MHIKSSLITWLPWWLSSTESFYSVADSGDMSSVPGSGRSPGGGSGNPLQDSCLENFRAEESGGLQSMESQRVRYEWATEPTYVCKTYTYMHTHVHMSTYQYLPSTLSICLSISFVCIFMSAFSYLICDLTFTLLDWTSLWWIFITELEN